MVSGAALLAGRLRHRRAAPAPGPAPAAAPAKAPPRPAAYQSEDFIVTFAQPGDTPETLAARYLGGADKGVDDRGLHRAAAPSRPARRS